ncbi:hypothetical protein D3C75_1127940 [compost metagenome]
MKVSTDSTSRMTELSVNPLCVALNTSIRSSVSVLGSSRSIIGIPVEVDTDTRAVP